MANFTLAAFKITAGVAPDAWAHERRVRELRQVYFPGVINKREGWWWAICTDADVVLAAGWAAGSVRDRNVDIARAMVRFDARRAA